MTLYKTYFFLFVLFMGVQELVDAGAEPGGDPLLVSEAVSSEGDLNLLVQQYLFSENQKQSEDLLKEILAHKEATLLTLEMLLRDGRLYPPEPNRGSLHRSITVSGYETSYAMHVPQNYNAKTAYPLIVCLHGAGFVGDSYIDRWQSRLGANAILVCPTMANGAWWSPEGEQLVLKVIDEISLEYHINPDKIFLTGMSNGGIGVYLIGMFHADRFAGISPMAGGIPNEIFPFLKNFSNTGIYIIHGAHDQVMPVTLSREASDYLKKTGISYTYREHGQEDPSAGGPCFPREELPDLVKWFERQDRMETPARVMSVRDAVHLAPFYWTEMNQTEGKVVDVQKSILSNDEVELVKAGAFAGLTAEIDGNQVTVISERVSRFTLFFNNRLIDFSKPVRVVVNGQKRFEGPLTESATFLLKEAKRRQDGISFYTASVTVDLTH